MNDARRERQLGTITPNLQRYEADKAADWLDAVRRQVCPFCNEGPFTMVAGHVASKHGIDRRTFRDMLGLKFGEPICDPAYSAACRAITLERIADGRIPIPGLQGHSGPRRRSKRASAEGVGRQGRKVRSANFQDTRDNLVARFNNGEAADAIAVDIGVQRRYFRYYLRESGVIVPDGRAEKPTTYQTFICKWCGLEGSAKPATLRRNAQAPGYTGPYCGQSCSSKASMARRRATGWQGGPRPRSTNT